MAGSFSIAFVCTGNRFRSPLARAFVERLTLGLPIEVVTAGTLEIEGAPVLSEAQELGTWCGVDLSGHRSLPLSKLPLGDLDLVLGFEEQHVRRAVVDAGAAAGRSFMFRELVHLLGMIDSPGGVAPPTRARIGIERADELRRAEPSPGPVRSAVSDPFGRPWNVYRQTAAEIRELSIELVERLFGVTVTTGLPPVPERIASRHWFRLSARRRSLQRRWR